MLTGISYKSTHSSFISASSFKTDHSRIITLGMAFWRVLLLLALILESFSRMAPNAVSAILLSWQNDQAFIIISEWSLFYWFIERFSIECRKTKTKVITPTNHKQRKQHNGPIRTRSKCMQPVPRAGKRVQVRHDWFWFCFSLVEKVARILVTNHRVQ